METCGTCKHWQCDDDEAAILLKVGLPEFRTCMAVQHDKNSLIAYWKYSSMAWEDEMDEYEREKFPQSQDFCTQHAAIAVDGSGYYAALKTRSDFACKLHEPPEGPPCD